MDQVKIGKFILDMRKEQGLTQKQLAERLGVTDKTVSKWETGHRLPDASILPELGLVLKVDMNELLAGEKFSPQELSPEEYAKQSERNLVGLVGELNEIDKRSRSGSVGTVIGVSLTGLALLLLFASSLREGTVIDLIDLPTLIYLLGLKFAVLSVSGWFHDYLNAWKMSLPGKSLSEREMNLALQAVRYAGALTLILGCLIALLSSFSLLNYMNGLGLIFPSLAQIVLALLYTAILKTVYVVLEFRIKRELRRR